MPSRNAAKPKKTKSPFADVADLLTSYGAGLIADHINAFWKDRGAVVHAERYELPGGGGYGVRSQLFNGLPRLAQMGSKPRTSYAAQRRTEFLG